MGTKKFFYVVLAAVFIMAVSACAPTVAAQDPAAAAEQAGANADVAQAAEDAAAAAQEAANAAEEAANAAAAAQEAANASSQAAAQSAAAEPVVVEEESMASSGAPKLSVSQDTNCRVGPGDEYDAVAFIDTSSTVEITGWDGYGYFYTVKNPNGGEDCWVWSEFATIEGDTSGLELVKTPPTPEPSASWAGTWLMKIDGKTYNIVMQQDSKLVSGFFEKGGTDYRFNGVVSGDANQVNGKFVYEDDNGDEKEGRFVFSMIEGTYNQFQGNANPNSGKTWDWCGGRNGAGLPGTCGM